MEAQPGQRTLKLAHVRLALAVPARIGGGLKSSAFRAVDGAGYGSPRRPPSLLRQERIYVAILTRGEDIMLRESVALFLRLSPQLNDSDKGIIVQGNLSLTSVGLGAANGDDAFEQVHILPAQVLKFDGTHSRIEREHNSAPQPLTLRAAEGNPKKGGLLVVGQSPAYRAGFDS